MTRPDSGRDQITHAAPAGVALVIIDMINDFDFVGAERLEPKARRAADAILRLRAEADRLRMPVVYVNDNYGQWHSERSKIIKACARNARARVLIERMAPRPRDYFVIKPQFSGFYATNLPVLLPKLGVNRLVITGVSAEICVLFTAADAHMRDYALWIPQDAVASESEARSKWALAIARHSMAAETGSTERLDIATWVAGLPVT